MGKGEVVTRVIKNVELCKPHNFDNPCSYQSFNFDLELRGMRYISRRRSGRKRRFRGDIGHYVHGYPYFPVQAERRVQYRDRLKGLYVVARKYALLLADPCTCCTQALMFLFRLDFRIDIRVQG